jgi:hypothetical protein
MTANPELAMMKVSGECSINGKYSFFIIGKAVRWENL